MSECKPRKDLTGVVFGYLTVISYAYNDGGRSHWNCRCKCGSDIVRTRRDLMSGHTKSCGCYNNEARGSRVRTHGLCHTPEYHIWFDIKRRCLDPNRKWYSHYGGRNITICDRWKTDFKNFYNDMGPRPSRKHSIDRIDNNGDYCPENCRWATQKEQCNNKRNNIRLEYKGEIMPLMQIATLTGFSYVCLYSRIYRGWSLSEAISTPYKGRRNQPQ